MYGTLKALHIIFIVTWFSGLFYIVRLFVYYAEALEGNKPEEWKTQLQLMQKRLWYGITWPSAVLATTFGLSLLQYFSPIPPWLWLKLGFVAGLLLYQGYCQVLFNKQSKGERGFSSLGYRIWNELATLFLVAIVFLVVLKDGLSMLNALLGLVLFAVILMFAIKLYKRIRETKDQPTPS